MLDFVQIKVSASRKDVVDVYPEFITRRSKDLMIKGNSFYAIWNDTTNLWTTSEYDAQLLIDNETINFASNYETSDKKVVKLLKNFSSRKWTEWKQYCKSMPDSYHDLDEKILFSNQNVKKSDYVTKKLSYPLQEGNISSYDELIGTIYDPDEKQKLEWAIGAIISGDSKRLQKFIVLYGDPGSGKSTFLNIVEKLFPGYYVPFDAKSLTGNNQFALEAFKTNPLIAIQHDGDLSKIEDNTRLNSIVSHEEIVVNEKFKSTYSSKFKTFLFLGTNTPVMITDSKSGLVRRLIDVYPSGRLVDENRYYELVDKINFELGAIAYHCLEVYKSLGFGYYSTYRPIKMIKSTNDFYNFISDNFPFFTRDWSDGVSLDTVWQRYKVYCEDSNIKFPYNKRKFANELSNYFRNVDGNFYKEFIKDKFKINKINIENTTTWINLKKQDSIFDNGFEGCLAQYATNDELERPISRWNNVKTKLMDLDTSKTHYVKLPENIIKIDFDMKDNEGKKSLELNIKEASKWPETYCEVSKSGNGLHLYYIYDGDISKLKNIYDKDIEIKTHIGNSASRRRLTLCNNKNISTITSGLPLKEEDNNMLNAGMIMSERSLRYQVARNLKKEIHQYTKPSIDFIYKILEDAYNSGLRYDIRDMAPDIQQFANNSHNNAEYCLQIVSKMKFVGKETEESNQNGNISETLIFYDVEVFPNLFVLCWKKQGENGKVVKLINPTPEQVRAVMQFPVIGFNNRNYDNHICWARMMGYNNEQLFNLSKKIIDEGILKAGFNEAYNISYTDVYDFLSAKNKMSLKKWEIKLGIHHVENGHPWDKTVPEEYWNEIADYCANDVIATEAVFDANQKDFRAREILADLSGMTLNNTTNQLTMQIICGNDKHPQDKFIYTDLSTIFPGYEFNKFGIDKSKYKEGTKIVKGKSLYMGEDPGEGGYVYAKPGIYHDVALLDVASMHPSSIEALNLFGPYTKNYVALKECRVAIKHKEYNKVKDMFNGRISKYLGSEDDSKGLADALKTALNSAYGLTSATFPNRLKDPRNIDNIVAKRGALFMISLKNELLKRNIEVIHIKTDSVKVAIPKANEDIIKFVMEYGRKYGYEFENEAVYKKMCLINESTYIALVSMYDGKDYTTNPFWTATGTEFQVPYVFKTLFSHEAIEFDDLCETKSVTTALYLDFNEDLPDVTNLEKERDKLVKNGESTEELDKEIASGHEYRFVGRVGQFTPVVSGIGGGILLRDAGDGKYSSVVGTKKKDGKSSYRWMESEMVKKLGLQDKVDISYYDSLVDGAIEEISKFGDPNKFMDVNESIWINPPEYTDEPLPFD